MDAVAGLLDGPRARGAFLLRSSLDPPWSLRIQDEAPLRWSRWSAARRGSCPTRASRCGSRPGDVAIVRGPDPYTVADDPATPTAGRHPPRAALHDARRRGARS